MRVKAQPVAPPPSAAAKSWDQQIKVYQIFIRRIEGSSAVLTRASPPPAVASGLSPPVIYFENSDAKSCILVTLRLLRLCIWPFAFRHAKGRSGVWVGYITLAGCGSPEPYPVADILFQCNKIVFGLQLTLNLLTFFFCPCSVTRVTRFLFLVFFYFFVSGPCANQDGHLVSF